MKTIKKSKVGRKINHFEKHKEKYMYTGVLAAAFLHATQWMAIKAVLVKILISFLAAAGLYTLVDKIQALPPISDQNPPVATVSYAPDVSTLPHGLTNQDVTVTLTFDEPALVSIDGISASSGYVMNISSVFTGDHTKIFTFADAAGNSASLLATVDYIDKIPPTASVDYSITWITHQPVITTLTGLSEPVTITNNWGSATYTFTGNGTFAFEFVDYAGNTGIALASVLNIAHASAPTALIAYSTTWVTNQNVVVTLTWLSDSATITNNSWSSVYVFTDNGTFTFTFVDAFGTTWSATATVTWIDKVPPTASVSYLSTFLSNDKKVVSVLSFLTGISEPIIITDNSWSDAYTFTANGTFTFTFVDLAGNTGSAVATVTKIWTKQWCNEWIGNGKECCDPGNSYPHRWSNDEDDYHHSCSYTYGDNHIYYVWHEGKCDKTDIKDDDAKNDKFDWGKSQQNWFSDKDAHGQNYGELPKKVEEPVKNIQPVPVSFNDWLTNQWNQFAKMFGK